MDLKRIKHNMKPWDNLTFIEETKTNKYYEYDNPDYKPAYMTKEAGSPAYGNSSTPPPV